MRFLVAYVIIVSAVIGASEASATYSVLIADTRSKQLGAAVATCVPAPLTGVFGSAPGRGAILAQGYVSGDGGNRAVGMIAAGRDPEDVVQAITAEAFDPDASQRQYGIVDTAGRAAVYTGTALDPWLGARSGRSEPFVYTVQGNLLSSDRVLVQAEEAVRAKACDLPERLMLALEAGARDGGGDVRCTPHGLPATSAMLRVDGADGNVVVHLSAVVRTKDSAVARLRQDFDAWRVNHPCSTGGCAGCAAGGNNASPDWPGSLASELSITSILLLARFRRRRLRSK